MKKLFSAAFVFLWLVPVLAHAQNTTCATRPAGDSSNACASTAFVHGGFLTSTGWTPNNPLIGSSIGGVTQGTRSGNTTAYITADGTLTNGHCSSIDSHGGIVDAGGPCTIGGGGGTVSSGLAQQYAYYPANGPSVAGFEAPFLHSKNFGAAGDGITPDSVALQSWINACQTSGQACFLDPGTYLLENNSAIPTPLSIAGSITITAPNFMSSLLSVPISINAINVNTTSPVYFYNFGINYSTAANSGTAGISVTAPFGSNSSSVFRDLRILNPSVGIKFISAAAYTMDNIKIEEFGSNGINIANVSAGDTGDSTITSGYYAGAPGSNACVFWESSGGLKFNHNKCVTTANGFQIDLAAGVNTSQIIVTDNSFDGLSSIAFLASRQSTSGSLVGVIFVGNTCSSALQCFTIPYDATSGSWISGVQISGNTYYGTNSGSNVFAEFSSGLGVTAVNNTLTSNISSTTAFICNGNAGTVTYGIFTKVGTFAANTNSCSATAISPN